eukprot:s49_g5.t3
MEVMEASACPEKVSVESVESVEESRHRVKIRVQTIFAELLVTNAAPGSKTSEVGGEALKLAQTDRPLPKYFASGAPKLEMIGAVDKAAQDGAAQEQRDLLVPELCVVHQFPHVAMLTMHAETWGDQLRAYEREKRYVVDAGFVSGQPLRLQPGMFQAQERTFDPVLGRYRDGAVESQQRHAEERERVAHLNRAKDIQILREQPFNILSQESKLDKLAPGKDPMRLGGHGTLGEKERTKEGKGNFPDTAVDYNILSNLPFKDQHWATKDRRPRMKEKSPRIRKRPAFLCKDFDIVTNRYLDNHSEKLRQEKRVNLLEATEKHMKTNAFDPLVGKFVDPLVEERVKSIDDAREVEINMRGDAKFPPSYKGRETAAYGIVSHETHDKDMLRLYDTLEKERTGRFKNRHIVDHNFHAQDIKGDHINELRQLNRVAPERYEEQRRRGYDIIDGKGYGPGAKEKILHEAFPKPRLTPWEKATVAAPGAASERFMESSPSRSVGSLRSPQEVKTLRPSQIVTSSSAPQLATPAASVRSRASSKRSQGSQRSQRSVAMPPTPAPAAPSVPGAASGSAYSRPRDP